MALITLSEAHLAYGSEPLLDGAEFSLAEHKTIGLIGRNGTGKSSLLKVLAQLEQLDSGRLQLRNDLRLAYVPQEEEFNAQLSVEQTIKDSLKPILSLIEQYSNGQGDLTHLQSKIEACDGWNWQQRLDECLANFELPPHSLVGDLSGGYKKRLSLAKAFILQPYVLLLDEPTNHLDLKAIVWLEQLLQNFSGSCVVISHDRSFLDNVTQEIVELDRGKITSYPGNFAAYMQLKTQQLEQEAIINAKADKLLKQEEAWSRQGVEARRTKSQSRLNSLKELRRQHQQRRQALTQAKISLEQGELSGKIVADLENASKRFGDKIIVKDFSTTILRGDKVGLLGDNGCGKTTLLKLILGQLTADSGKIKLGTNLQIAYFDQMRCQLDLELKLGEFVSPNSEFVYLNGKRQHIVGYLNDFLFSPTKINSPIKTLSGGERNRLLLAKLFASPANVLVLDEPTNDLDIQTLEVLEELLQNYSGTVFLVSHDRTFMNNVVTSIIAKDQQDGVWYEYEGNVDDWLLQSQRHKQTIADIKPTKSNNGNATSQNNIAAKPKRKLSYKEQRELDELPDRITALENEQRTIEEQLQNSEIFANDYAKAQQLSEKIAVIEEELLRLLERWEELSNF